MPCRFAILAWIGSAQAWASSDPKNWVPGYKPTCADLLEFTLRPELRYQRVLQALETYRPTTQLGYEAEIYQKAAPILAREIVKDFEEFGRARFSHALEAIRNPNIDSNSGHGLASVRRTVNKPDALWFSEDILGKVEGLHVLRHEVRHMKQAWSDSNLDALSFFFLKYRWNGILKNETDAFKAQYQFIVTALDIPKTFPIRIPSKSDEVKEAFLFELISGLDGINQILEIRSVSEAEFVEDAIYPYRSQNLMLNLDIAFPVFIFGSVSSGIVYLVTLD